MADQPLGERIARIEAILPEIRDEVREVRKMLTERLDKQEGRLDNQEDRIRNLERWRAWTAGAAAVVALIIDNFWRWLSATR